MMEITSNRRTVLMIHGWAQNAHVMKSRTKKLYKRISELGYDCIYLEAPHLLPMTSMVEVDGQLVEVTNGGRENAKAWFMYSEKDPPDASKALQETPIEYYGLEASISMIRDRLCKLETSPCTIFGFSQGATFVHILSILASAARNKPDCEYLSPFAKVDSGILVSGFASMHQGSLTDNAHTTDAGGLITIRSLHIMGERDTSVPKSYGTNLLVSIQSRRYTVTIKATSYRTTKN
ncbi:hypothetical protein ACHAWT_003781 [Skeletonema menzelii]